MLALLLRFSALCKACKVSAAASVSSTCNSCSAQPDLLHLASSSTCCYMMQSKHAASYEPPQIARDKYAKVVQGRNRFILLSTAAVTLFLGLSSLPHYLIHRAARRVYSAYCRGKILDLSPKLYDANDVALYEHSRAVLVEYLVEQRVTDAGHYHADNNLPAEAQHERRRAMTLDFMLRNDHHWVGSSVNFGLVERATTMQSDFRRYDCVVVRDELMIHDTDAARRIFDGAAAYLSAQGHFLVLDFGKPDVRWLCRLLHWFRQKSHSSMYLTHDYHAWLAESLLYDVVEERRCLLGAYYALVLRLRDTTVKAAAPR